MWWTYPIFFMCVVIASVIAYRAGVRAALTRRARPGEIVTHANKLYRIDPEGCLRVIGKVEL